MTSLRQLGFDIHAWSAWMWYWGYHHAEDRVKAMAASINAVILNLDREEQDQKTWGTSKLCVVFLYLLFSCYASSAMHNDLNRSQLSSKVDSQIRIRIPSIINHAVVITTPSHSVNVNAPSLSTIHHEKEAWQKRKEAYPYPSILGLLTPVHEICKSLSTPIQMPSFRLPSDP